MGCTQRLGTVLPLLPVSVKTPLEKCGSNLEGLREIRLRSSKPVVLVTDRGCSFLTDFGKQTYLLRDSLVSVSREELNETVKRVCGYSVYTHEDDIINGFVTVRGGHRVGLCGTAVTENGKTVSVRDINSVNIRIADEVFGCADGILKSEFTDGLKNIIIAGMPLSGKTTVLRDLARQLSDGCCGRFYKCAVIDERSEIAAVNNGTFENDVGHNTDVLSNYPKAEAISAAVRTLSPDIVFCDETAAEEEADAILNGIMCGVHFAVTVHIGSINDLYLRSVPKRLINSGLFQSAVILGTGTSTGKISEIIKVGEQIENRGNNAYSVDMPYNRIFYGKAVP